jgi:hypothetical protein
MAGPLSGIRVLDLTRVLAGPWATQMLADFGAEVIKIEKPGEGDDTRGWGPPFITNPDGSRGDAAYFLSANRGKWSVCHRHGDARRARRSSASLAAKSDVVIENFKVGGLKKYGLDYDSLKAVNPRPHLLLDHRLRPERALCAARRLRLHDPGHGRHHVDDRPAGRHAGCGAHEDRRRLRRHLHRPLCGDRHPGALFHRERTGRAISSTWRCSIHRWPCWPTRR